jgi:hypothetical protein
MKIFLEEFEETFAKSTHSPLVRTLDHRIPLIPGFKLINIKLYKISYIHRGEYKNWSTKYYKMKSYNIVAALVLFSSVSQ